MELLFLDTETTGLKSARIVQLAYKKKDDTNVFVEYYKPPIPIEIEAMATHHITEKQVSDKLNFIDCESYKVLCNLLKNSILIAHNASFDIQVLKNEKVEVARFICTYKVARTLYEYDSYKLQYLRYLWNIEINDINAHDAKGDVLVLEAVFNYILNDYCNRNGCDKNKAIEFFIDISSKPLLLKTITFGKHQGKSFLDIKREDPTYLQWLAKLEDKDEDFKYTVNYYLTSSESSKTTVQYNQCY